MATSPRAFALRHTHLRAVPNLEEIRLHLADEVLPLWHAVQIETDDPDPALPYWAFGRAGSRSAGTCATTRRPPRVGGYSTWHPAPDSARSRRCTPARPRRPAPTS